MPEPTKIPRPFADSGDKNSIPDSSGGLGFASWQEGFPAITGTPFAQGGVAPKRADFNGIFNALSLATVWQQQGGFYAYDATTDYEVGNVVEYNNDLYKCLTANGPSSAVKAPTDTTVWSKVMTAADVASGYLPLTGGTMSGAIKGTLNLLLTANDTSHEARFSGGTGLSDGASFIAYGKDNAGAGQFRIRAYGDKDLIGKSDGTLTWNGGEVERLEQHVKDSYIRFSSGLMIILARTLISASGTSITFAYPFASTPIIVASPAPPSENTDVYTIITTNRTATGFTLFANKGATHADSYAGWHAIGRWK